ncbi:MAG: hypothetical protein COA73_03905 [Candidatus Hydrogenedentota bacterium]|nr:MAG: hypothetical protein COA73_03905 [Candidatus Hydrogenedentota bacterium]
MTEEPAEKDQEIVDIEPAELLKKLEETPELLRVIQSISWQGPLPHPETLKQYGEIEESFPNRIIQLTEKEQAYRHKLQNDTSKNVYTLEKNGQYIGFLIALIAIPMIGYIAMNAHPAVGSVAVGAVSSVVGYGLYLKRKNSGED